MFSTLCISVIIASVGRGMSGWIYCGWKGWKLFGQAPFISILCLKTLCTKLSVLISKSFSQSYCYSYLQKQSPVVTAQNPVIHTFPKSREHQVKISKIHNMLLFHEIICFSPHFFTFSLSETTFSLQSNNCLLSCLLHTCTCINRMVKTTKYISVDKTVFCLRIFPYKTPFKCKKKKKV